MDNMENKAKIKLVCGRICSGKGSYGQPATRIVVSDVVRHLIKSTDRNKLQETLHLEDLIANKIIELLDNAIKTDWDSVYIVDGIRQVSIVEKVLEHYPDAELIWLEVSTEERKRRYEARKDIKDVEPFEIADNKNIELECQRIYHTFRDRLLIVNNYLL